MPLRAECQSGDRSGAGAADSREVLGFANTAQDLAEVIAYSGSGKRSALMDGGVTIQLPETVLIDPDVAVGKTRLSNLAFRLLGQNQNRRRCTFEPARAVRRLLATTSTSNTLRGSGEPPRTTALSLAPSRGFVRAIT